jgi:hypothetical protein
MAQQQPQTEQRQQQSQVEPLNMQELGKECMSGLKQNLTNALSQIREAAVAGFNEIGDRCHKVVGFMVAHATGRGAEANQMALNGFKEDVVGAFKAGVNCINQLQDTHRRNEVNHLIEKQINKVEAVLGEIGDQNLKQQGSEITDKMKTALAKAYEDASSTAYQDNGGLFSQEIRDQLKKDITKITKEASSEVWGLRGQDIVEEKAEALREMLDKANLTGDDKTLALQAIEAGVERYQSNREGLKDMNQSELQVAEDMGKAIERDLERRMRVLDRIEKLEDAATKINDQGINNLIGELRGSLKDYTSDSVFTGKEFQQMQAELDEARNRIMGFQFRGKLAEGVQRIANMIDVDAKELEAPVGQRRNQKTAAEQPAAEQQNQE